MYKACSKCGKIHGYNVQCTKRIYKTGDDRKLRSKYAWTLKSQEIREKANYLCEVCRDEGVVMYDDVEVHHITKIIEDESLLLENKNLICLCQYHHKLADKGEINKEYLQRLAEAREQGRQPHRGVQYIKG